MTKIAVIVGSLQAKSFNKLLAKNLETLLPEGAEFNYVEIGNFPLFNQDLEADFPKVVTEAKKIVDDADGVLFVTPEYNRSLPGPLKNAIDWISRPWGHNSFAGKPTGIVGASPSPLGTAVAQSDLRHISGFLNVKLMGQPELYLVNAHTAFDEQGVVVDSSKEFLQNYITALVNWVNREEELAAK